MKIEYTIEELRELLKIKELTESKSISSKIEMTNGEINCTVEEKKEPIKTPVARTTDVITVNLDGKSYERRHLGWKNYNKKLKI